MKKYLEYFAETKKKDALVYKFFNSLSRRQSISLCLIFFVFVFNVVYANTSGQDEAILSQSFKSIQEVLEKSPITFYNDVLKGTFISSFSASYFIVDIVKNVMSYISKIQIQSITSIAKLDFGSENMFEHVVSGLTIFAVIGCVYKLVMHFLRTERLDSVSAYTGYFSYIGMFILFVFSSTIVDRVVSLNKPMSENSVNQIFVKIDAELNKNIQQDFKQALLSIEKLEKEYENLNWNKPGDLISNRLEKLSVQVWDMGFKHMAKYFYYAFFSLIMAVVLAIPAFSITFMVKILLGVMMAGTKLVFLISFIPGFENTWKTYMLNLLNVILWIPIFNAIIAFLTNVIAFTISDNSMGTGQIIWLSLVVVVGAFQSISLTTTSASTIINGAGAGMAGAMGSLASMNAASMVAGAGQAALSTATTAFTASVSSASTVSSLQKFLK